MKIQDKKIQDFVNKVILRIRWRNTLKVGLIGFLSALSFALLLEVTSRLLPIIELPMILLTGGVALIIAGLFVGFLFPVDKKRAILEADSHGLDERAITAYGLIDEDSAMSELQKEDAVAHIENFSMKKLTVKPPKKLYIAAGVLAFLMLVAIFLPNPMEDRVKALTELNKDKKAAMKIIKQEEKKIDKNSKLSAEDKAKLKKELSEFRKLIKNAKNKTDMAKATMQMDKKLQLMGKKDAEKRLKDIANSLGNKDATKKVAEALKSGDPEKVKKLLEQLAKSLASKDKAELKKLADALAKAASELKDDKKMSDALAKLAKDIQDGKLSESADQMSALADSLSKMVADGELDGELGELAGELRKASPLELADDGQLSIAGKTPGDTPGNQAGSGSGSGTGNGNGGNGNGPGSSGAGNGSSPGSENQKATDYGNGIGHRAKPGEGKISDFDKVWTAKNVGGTGDRSNLKGKPGSGGTTAQAETDRGMTTAGTAVTYDKVIGEYTKDAVEGLSSKELPPALEKLVRDYFSGLGE